ncbi:hypothetical protein [Bifidobacterium sp.]|uniref:hypothetical protein n=1 Tax=Bifidobacterium sp. TaxID=41200 RepID=UPI003D7D230C
MRIRKIAAACIYTAMLASAAAGARQASSRLGRYDPIPRFRYFEDNKHTRQERQ